MTRIVRKIAPAQPPAVIRPRRVAAYARVSVPTERLLHSLDEQISYYSALIQSTPGWEYAGVFADRGVSGTQTVSRDEFQRLLSECEAGHIDLILTKSLSRFARNTVDTLETVRRLKRLGVEVRFEKENIWTFDGKGELMISIMSSLAQEESRSISENCVWGQRKRFADGKVTVPFGRFLGYDRGPDGNLVVNEEQAKVMRRIYALLLEGNTPYAVSKILTEDGVPTPGGKKNWSKTVVLSILKNEKYKGDALLQKVYTEDFLTKKKVRNSGQVPQYYVEGNHEAIVSPEVFDLVQQKLAWRRSLNGRYSGRSCFASRVVCGDCGAFYGSKVWHSTDEYRRTVWRCNNKYAGETRCATPHVTQEALEKAFVQVMQRVLSQKDKILTACREALDEAFDTTELDKAATRLQDQALGMAERVRLLVDENARVHRDQDEFKEDYEALLAEHARLSEKIQAIAEQKRDKAERRRRIEIFLHMLEEQKECADFEPGMFVALVDKVIIQHDGRLEFCFRNGMKCEYPQ